MARPSATAALLLVLSLLAVTRCRTVAVAADHVADEPESTDAVDVSDYDGLSSNPTTLTAEAPGASATEEEEEEEALRAEQQRGFDGFLRQPSYHPCRLRRHPRRKTHHGVYYRDPACIKFHDHDHGSGHEGERHDAVSHLAVILPAEETRETEEVKPVAEPNPDRSLPDSDDREGELVASREPWSFADADGHDVEPWKKEMLQRWLRYVYFHFHHGLLSHRLHHVHHGQEEEDKEKNMVRKRLLHAEHGGGDSDDEDEEMEEMVRLFRKAFMRMRNRRRRRFGHDDEAEHGRRFFHHLHLHHHDNRHHHAEEAETKRAAGGEEQSGVMDWIKGLINRFLMLSRSLERFATCF